MLDSGKEKNAPLMLCHYLNPASIVIEKEASSKEEVLNSLILKLCEVAHLKDCEAVKKAVWDREKEGRTVLENGLAIPHARFSGIHEIKASLGIIPQAYLDAQEGVKVKIVFLFLSPQDQFRSHLQMLARISRIFQDNQFIEKILQASHPEEAFELLQRKERSIE